MWLHTCPKCKKIVGTTVPVVFIHCSCGSTMKSEEISAERYHLIFTKDRVQRRRYIPKWKEDRGK